MAGYWSRLKLPSRYRRSVALGEVSFVALLILAYIWRIQFVYYHFPAFILFFILLTLPLHGDTPATLGLSARNLGAATRNALLVGAAFALIFLAVGFFSGRLRIERPASEAARWLWHYFAWCVFQQFGLQSFLTNRLLEGLKGSRWAPLVSGAIFAAFHLPNPILVPATLLGGWAMSELFRRERNILPLAAAQALLGALISITISPGIHHNLRVGPGYWRPLN